MRSRHALLLAAAAAGASACGGGGSTPVTPTSPTPAPVSAGMVRGAYVLRVEPAVGCGAPGRSYSFRVTAAPDNRGRYPAVQAVDVSPLPYLEIEAIDGSELRGSVGTTELGTASIEGLRVWARLLVTGPLAARTDGTAEVLAGTAAGDLEFGIDESDEGGLGSCTSTAHGWSLRRS